MSERLSNTTLVRFYRHIRLCLREGEKSYIVFNAVRLFAFNTHMRRNSICYHINLALTLLKVRLTR